MSFVFKCPHITKIVCANVQEYYIMNHVKRYISTLENMEYINSVGICKKKSKKEISNIWQKHLTLHNKYLKGHKTENTKLFNLIDE